MGIVNDNLIAIALVLATCVAAFGFLWNRKRYKNTAQLVAAGVTAGNLEPALREEERDIGLAFGLQAPSGESIIELIPWSADAPAPRGNQLDLSSDQAAKLAPVMQSLGSLAQSAEAHSGGYMQVVINGPLAESKAVADAFQPYVRDSKNQIQEVAILKDPKNLKKIANLTAAWQIASVVVAQQHLADISEKLSEIKDGVKRIEEFLDRQRLSRILACIQYLEPFSRGGIDINNASVIRSQLEGIERDLLEIQNHIKNDLEKLSDHEIKQKEFIGSGDYANDINEYQCAIANTYQQWILCMQARLAAWQILSAFPGELSIKQLRRESIEREVREMLAPDGLVNRININTNYMISKIRAIFNTESTLQKRQGAARIICEENTEFLKVSGRGIAEQADIINQRLLSYHNPVRLAFRLDESGIADVIQVDQVQSF